MAPTIDLAAQAAKIQHLERESSRLATEMYRRLASPAEAASAAELVPLAKALQAQRVDLIQRLMLGGGGGGSSVLRNIAASANSTSAAPKYAAKSQQQQPHHQIRTPMKKTLPEQVQNRRHQNDAPERRRPLAAVHSPPVESYRRRPSTPSKKNQPLRRSPSPALVDMFSPKKFRPRTTERGADRSINSRKYSLVEDNRPQYAKIMELLDDSDEDVDYAPSVREDVDDASTDDACEMVFKRPLAKRNVDRQEEKHPSLRNHRRRSSVVSVSAASSSVGSNGPGRHSSLSSRCFVSPLSTATIQNYRAIDRNRRSPAPSSSSVMPIKATNKLQKSTVKQHEPVVVQRRSPSSLTTKRRTNILATKTKLLQKARHDGNNNILSTTTVIEKNDHSNPLSVALFADEAWNALLAETIRLRRKFLTRNSKDLGPTTLMNLLNETELVRAAAATGAERSEPLIDDIVARRLYHCAWRHDKKDGCARIRAPRRRQRYVSKLIRKQLRRMSLSDKIRRTVEAKKAERYDNAESTGKPASSAVMGRPRLANDPSFQKLLDLARRIVHNTGDGEATIRRRLNEAQNKVNITRALARQIYSYLIKERRQQIKREEQFDAEFEKEFDAIEKEAQTAMSDKTAELVDLIEEVQIVSSNSPVVSPSTDEQNAAAAAASPAAIIGNVDDDHLSVREMSLTPTLPSSSGSGDGDDDVVLIKQQHEPPAAQLQNTICPVTAIPPPCITLLQMDIVGTNLVVAEPPTALPIIKHNILPVAVAAPVSSTLGTIDLAAEIRPANFITTNLTLEAKAALVRADTARHQPAPVQQQQQQQQQQFNFLAPPPPPQLLRPPQAAPKPPSVVPRTAGPAPTAAAQPVQPKKATAAPPDKTTATTALAAAQQALINNAHQRDPEDISPPVVVAKKKEEQSRTVEKFDGIYIDDAAMFDLKDDDDVLANRLRRLT